MLRTAGAAAAGAVAGAVVLGQASPAAAATSDTGNPAILGTASPTSGIGVRGVTSSGTGVHGEATSTSAANATGVHGTSASSVGLGVLGSASSSTGATRGVYGSSVSTDGIGVFGVNANIAGPTTGVEGAAASPAGAGVRARCNAGTGAIVESQRTQLRFDGTPPNPTASGSARVRGEIVCDLNGDLWMCVASGTPGTWRRLAGPAAAGSLVALPTTKRVYDSRTGQAPVGVGPKTPLEAATARTVDLKANSSGVPAGATAVLVSLVATGTTSGVGGYMTIYRNGISWPGTSNLNWSGPGQSVAVTTLTAVDAQSRCALYAGSVTDVVVDVLGYYR